MMSSSMLMNCFSVFMLNASHVQVSAPMRSCAIVAPSSIAGASEQNVSMAIASSHRAILSAGLGDLNEFFRSSPLGMEPH